MYENCHTVEEALSFATWFEIYGGHNHRIEEPYKFLAYFYDIFDLNPVKYNAQIITPIMMIVCLQSRIPILWVN